MEKKTKTEKKTRVVVKEAGEVQEAGEVAKEEGARGCGVVRASTPAGGRGEAASEGRWMRCRPQMCLGTRMYQVWTRMGMGMGIGMGDGRWGVAVVDVQHPFGSCDLIMNRCEWDMLYMHS